MSVICITQARLGSTRLPGKVLKTINDITLIAYHFNRVALSKYVNQHWLSTSGENSDDALAEYAKQHNWNVFRGSESNVLERFYHTALKAGATLDDTIVRLTGDCPLICPDLLDIAISQHHVHNRGENGYTHLALEYIPRGFDVEVFSMQALTKTYFNASTADECEHVTYHMYTHPQDFDIHSVKQGKVAWSKYRLCVDEIDDFLLVEQLIGLINKCRGDCMFVKGDDICRLLDKHPELTCINQAVNQKTTH